LQVGLLQPSPTLVAQMPVAPDRPENGVGAELPVILSFRPSPVLLVILSVAKDLRLLFVPSAAVIRPQSRNGTQSYILT